MGCTSNYILMRGTMIRDKLCISAENHFKSRISTRKLKFALSLAFQRVEILVIMCVIFVLYKLTKGTPVISTCVYSTIEIFHVLSLFP